MYVLSTSVLFQVQFVLVFFHAFQLLFIDCDYPRAFVWWIGMHAVLFYYLFSDFYKQAYLKKSKVRLIYNIVREIKTIKYSKRTFETFQNVVLL